MAVSKYAAPFSILIGTLYGITDEFHQTFVPHRSASLMDLCANFLGLLFAQFLLHLKIGAAVWNPALCCQSDRLMHRLGYPVLPPGFPGMRELTTRATKLAGEHLSRTLFEGERHVVILRPFNVYGPGQSREYAGVVAKFLERLARGEPPVIYGDGRQTRDLVYVADVVEALERALEVEVDGNAVVNVGTGRPVTINELAYRMIRIAGADVKPIYAPPRRGDIRHSYASISRAVSLLRWRPRVSLEEGLEETIKAFFSEQGGAGS